MMREHRSLAPPQLMDELYRRKLPHWRSEGELEQKFNYILGNPWRRWPSLDGYAWVWPSD